MAVTTTPSRIWPWMCAPAVPAREGSLRTPAARIGGVASRNANRAASSWSRPRHRPPAMVTPERLIPANRGDLRQPDVEAVAERQPGDPGVRGLGGADLGQLPASGPLGVRARRVACLG